ncbi:hypothetical protein [Paenibacillus sp. 2TAB19]|uniref:hypothetical protein n=1 Tax=Paenibacillus sp. 2TAB19 TaxID=3233003 RepID=UPI003F9755B8
MNKKIVMTILLAVIAGVVLFLQIGVKPKELPNAEQAAAAIIKQYPEAGVKNIQDIVKLDARHAFVPFVTDQSEHGMSFWVWDGFKWEIGAIQINVYPHIWGLRANDPSSRYIVWNMSPGSTIQDLTFYFIRDRNGGRTNGMDYYNPRIQMEWKAILAERSYGAVKIPKEWAAMLETDGRMQSAKLRRPFMFEVNPRISSYYIGYIPALSGEKATPFAHNVSGGWNNGSIDLEFVRILNEAELEFPR